MAFKGNMALRNTVLVSKGFCVSEYQKLLLSPLFMQCVCVLHVGGRLVHQGVWSSSGHVGRLGSVRVAATEGLSQQPCCLLHADCGAADPLGMLRQCVCVQQLQRHRVPVLSA